MRKAEITRKTAETELSVALALDGTGRHDNLTGVPFFDHMLDQLARHAPLDLTLRAGGPPGGHPPHRGGLRAPPGAGPAPGPRRQARDPAHGRRPGADGRGPGRGRDRPQRAPPSSSGRSTSLTPKIGTFDTELVREFSTAFAMNAGLTLNVARLDGANGHRIAEACFKAVAQALRAAIEPDPRGAGVVPSTKGTLSE